MDVTIKVNSSTPALQELLQEIYQRHAVVGSTTPGLSVDLTFHKPTVMDLNQEIQVPKPKIGVICQSVGQFISWGDRNREKAGYRSRYDRYEHATWFNRPEHIWGRQLSEIVVWDSSLENIEELISTARITLLRNERCQVSHDIDLVLGYCRFCGRI